MSGFFDVAAKASEAAKTESNQSTQRFDADKRIDVEKDKKDDGKEKRFDPDKRIDVKEQLDKAIKQYKKELVDNAVFPETLKLDQLRSNDIKRVTGQELKEARDDFKHNKGRYIEEWEKATGKEWPRYKEDFIKDGVLIAKAGDLYDAHHILPLSWGGENSGSNITPMEWTPHHNGVHGKDSGYNKVGNIIKSTVN